MAAAVTVTVPGLLARFTGGERAVGLRADTVGECVDRLIAEHPALEPHLLDGSGGLRTHLQLFHNGSGVAVDEADAVELDDGDEVVILQAVSGG